MKNIFLGILIFGSFSNFANAWTPEGWTANCNFSEVKSYNIFNKPQFDSEPHISYMTDSLEECLSLSGHYVGVNQKTALKVEYINSNKKSYTVIVEEKN